VSALVNRGAANIALGDFGTAERDCAAALRIDPRSAPALSNQALARNLAGKHARASQDHSADSDACSRSAWGLAGQFAVRDAHKRNIGGDPVFAR